MKPKHLFIIGVMSLLISGSIFGCKKENSVKPEGGEIATLKIYYANTARVDVSTVQFDASADEFSINGKFKISHQQLLKYYNESLTGRSY
jgi:hypothetical protein